MELFWHRGYAATGLDQLVRHTGASRYGLYATFGGKRDLFLASLERYSQAVMDPMLGPLEAAQASAPEIRSFFGRVLDLIRIPGDGRGCLMCNTAFERGALDAGAARGVRRDLVREVAVKVVERLPWGARVAPAGEHFLRHPRSALETAARAVATARRTGSATELKLAHSDLYVYTPVLVNLLSAFRPASPETPVRVARVDDVAQHAALREQRIDVAATFVGTWPVPGLEALQLVDCAATGVLLPAPHPLAAQPRVRLRDLSHLTWLHPSRHS